MDRDDDALSWDGDIRDPTHVDGPARAGSSSGDRPAATPDPAQSTGTADVEGATAPAAGGSVLLVVYAAIGGAYLLFTIGWVLAVTRDTVALPNPFFDVMYRVGSALAVAAPAAWFGSTFLLTRSRQGRRASAIRILCLVVGLLLVAPWPFIAGGAA